MLYYLQELFSTIKLISRIFAKIVNFWSQICLFNPVRSLPVYVSLKSLLKANLLSSVTKFVLSGAAI